MNQCSLAPGALDTSDAGIHPACWFSTIAACTEYVMLEQRVTYILLDVERKSTTLVSAIVGGDEVKCGVMLWEP